MVFYIHPREIDPAQPRLPMSRSRQFKSYVNLESTEAKIRRVLRDFPVTTFQNVNQSLSRVGKFPCRLTVPRPFFIEYAHDFDAIYGNQNGLVDSVINKLFRKSMRLRYEKSIEGCEPVQGKSVLDIGCGPGHYSITLAQRGASRVLGIDFAEGMLKLATEHAQKVGVGDRCKFEVADFYTYPPEEQFRLRHRNGLYGLHARRRKSRRQGPVADAQQGVLLIPLWPAGFWRGSASCAIKKRCDLFLYSEADLKRFDREISRSNGDHRADQSRLFRHLHQEREKDVAFGMPQVLVAPAYVNLGVPR